MVDQKLLVDEVKKIVSRDDVKYVVGFKKGTYGFTITPAFAYTPEYAEKFIFNPLCKKNLAVYPILDEKLPLKRGEEEDKRKIGVVVKGCDSRALVQIIQERGKKRDDLVIIGVPCKGVIDQKKIESKFLDIEEYSNIEDQNENFKISINGTDHIVPKKELLADFCTSCISPNPVIYDVLIGEKVEPWAIQDHANLEDLSKMNNKEKWAYWEEHFQRCIRCYACREACPLCYCNECMADYLEPQWIRRSVNLSENTAWNIMRAYHLAGRCVGCGECESVCPVNIPLMELNKQIEAGVKETFDYTAGMNVDEKPLFGMFKPDDPEEFIL
ncbi:MAG: 4Fe-4S dicluster domain-containing protein [Candidatus Heimdallarchaeaceae archaeon]